MRGGARRRLIVVVLIAAIYVAVWMCYTARFAASFDRFDYLAAGAPLVRDEAEYRIISVVQTPYVVDATKGPVTSVAGTTWVRAVVEAKLLQTSEDFTCDRPELLGAQGRRFDAESLGAYRPDQPYSCPDETVIGVPYRYEVIYSVPLSQVGGIVGFTLPTFYAGQVAKVARPA